jgi:C-terminal processing protease CtpA/Prc
VLEIEPADRPGERISVTLERTLGAGLLREARPEPVSELEEGIIYVDLTRLTGVDLDEVLPRLVDARGIVLDVRGYPHGLDPIRFFAHLCDEPLSSAQWHVPTVTAGGTTFERTGEWHIEPCAPRIEAPLAFLTDERAVSFAESCLGIVEHYRLGEIVGGPTAGTNGNAREVELPGGFRIRYTGLKVLKHDGSRHHGVGIHPTVPVERTRAGVAAGRDEVLERGIAAVKRAR